MFGLIYFFQKIPHMMYLNFMSANNSDQDGTSATVWLTASMVLLVFVNYIKQGFCQRSLLYTMMYKCTL